MHKLRPRFSLKMLLAGVVVVAIGAYFLMLPTFRAQRFTQFVNAKDLEATESMLPNGKEAASMHRMTLRRATSAIIAPLTLGEFVHGERRVLVTGWTIPPEDPTVISGPYPSAGSDTAQFVFHRSTVTEGAHGWTLW